MVLGPQKLEDMPPSNISHKLGSSIGGSEAPSRRSMSCENRKLFCAQEVHIVGTVLLGTNHLLRNLETWERLFEELFTIWPNLSPPPQFETLERHPYPVSNLTLRMETHISHSGGERDAASSTHYAC